MIQDGTQDFYNQQAELARQYRLRPQTAMTATEKIATSAQPQFTMTGRTHPEEGKLTLNANALDMHGHACADATRKFDLCDSCLYKVGKAIDAAMAPPTSAEGVEP